MKKMKSFRLSIRDMAYLKAMAESESADETYIVSRALQVYYDYMLKNTDCGYNLDGKLSERFVRHLKELGW